MKAKRPTRTTPAARWSWLLESCLCDRTAGEQVDWGKASAMDKRRHSWRTKEKKGTSSAPDLQQKVTY